MTKHVLVSPPYDKTSKPRKRMNSEALHTHQMHIDLLFNSVDVSDKHREKSVAKGAILEKTVKELMI